MVADDDWQMMYLNLLDNWPMSQNICSSLLANYLIQTKYYLEKSRKIYFSEAHNNKRKSKLLYRIPETLQDLHFPKHLGMHHCKEFSLAHWWRATSVTWHRLSRLAITRRDAAGCCGVRGSQAGRHPRWRGGGSMTGTVASRSRLWDNAALINFPFSWPNDQRHLGHDKNKVT